MHMFVNGQLWLTGTSKDNVIGEIARMNLEAHGTETSITTAMWLRSGFGMALTAPTLAAYMNVSSMDALLDHPHDDLRGVINMDGQDGEATNQGPLAGWLHGDAGRRIFSPRGLLDAVPPRIAPP